MEESKKDLEVIEGMCADTLSNFITTTKSNTQKVCLGLIQRLRDSSVALQVLFNNCNGIPGLEFSAGIILRSVVLDCLIGLNMFKIIQDNFSKGKEPLTDLEAFSNRILSDGLDHTLNYIQKSQKKNAVIKTKEQLIKTFATFAEEFKEFIKPYNSDGKRPELIFDKISTSDLFDNVLGEEILKNQVVSIWDAFQMYSKVDHFGILYFKVVEISMAKPMDNILRNLNILISHNSIMHLILYHTDRNNLNLHAKSNDALKFYITRGNLSRG
jgi:hypothetical protein